MAFLLMLLFGSGWLYAVLTRPAPVSNAAPLIGVTIPQAILGYKGEDAALDAATRMALAGTNLVCRIYRCGSETLQCVVASGETPGALHDPHDCLAGGGWHVVDDRAECLPGGLPAHSCHAVGRSGAPDMDVVYLFVINGRVTGDLTTMRAAMLWDALRGGVSGPDYMVRVIIPMTGRGQSEAAAHSRLLAFAGQVLAHLPPCRHNSA